MYDRNVVTPVDQSAVRTPNHALGVRVFLVLTSRFGTEEIETQLSAWVVLENMEGRACSHRPYLNRFYLATATERA